MWEIYWSCGGVGDKSYDGEISVIQVPGTAGVRYHYLEPRLDRRDRRHTTTTVDSSNCVKTRDVIS